jgi:hypothetical protein
MAVSIVERAEIVHVEEHKRDPLLSRGGWKRGDEFAVVRESGETIHVLIVGGPSGDSLARASVPE